MNSNEDASIILVQLLTKVLCIQWHCETTFHARLQLTWQRRVGAVEHVQSPPAEWSLWSLPAIGRCGETNM